MVWGLPFTAMARPRTKGEPIALRLPLSFDASLRQRAKAMKVSPHTLATALVVSAMRTETSRPNAGSGEVLSLAWPERASTSRMPR